MANPVKKSYISMCWRTTLSIFALLAMVGFYLSHTCPNNGKPRAQICSMEVVRSVRAVVRAGLKSAHTMTAL
jgi:hypothetical protein